MEGKEQKDKRQVIRSVYFYVASLVTLGIVVGSTIFLINLGFKSWVFTEAEPTAYRAGTPPSLSVSEKFAPVEEPEAFLTCEDTCTLTSEQSDTIETWETNYATWQESSKNSNSGRARDAVNAFSFLIIALPFFLIHFRIVQKDAKKETEKERAVIRPTYYYLISLASLLMIVIAGGMLINLGLKTWVFPSAGEADKVNQYDRVEPYQLSEKSSIYSIVDCGEKCGVDKETTALANQWITDYEAWDEASLHAYDNTQRQAASTIPFIIVGLPLFWYHWNTVRKESKDKKEA